MSDFAAELAGKVAGGDVYMNLAILHLEKHEWGLARLAIEKAFAKARLSDRAAAIALQQEIYQRMGSDSLLAR